MKQILRSDEVSQLSQSLKTQNSKIVLVGGCFDILHVGHIALLESAKQQGDVLIVLLESDATIAKTKGNGRPLHTQEQRATVLQALKSVDYVVLLNPHMTNEDYDNLVKLIQPDIIATTINDPGWEHKERQAKLVGAELRAVTQPINNVSTSRIVTQLHKEL